MIWSTCSEGPWSIDGALLVLEKWRPNIALSKMHLNFVSIWVQLHGLPLDYQCPELVERMGQMIGPVEKVDWEDRLPRNIRFMRFESEAQSMDACSFRLYASFG